MSVYVKVTVQVIYYLCFSDSHVGRPKWKLHQSFRFGHKFTTTWRFSIKEILYDNK